MHDFQAVYHRDSWDARAADGVHLTPSVRLLATPGHTPQDLSVLIGTPEQVVVLTHLWWTDQGPLEDPYAPDPEALRAQRERVLALADLVVPGHGPAFTPSRARPAKRTVAVPRSSIRDPRAGLDSEAPNRQPVATYGPR